MSFDSTTMRPSSIWAEMKEVTLPQAAALYLNVDPQVLPQNYVSSGGGQNGNVPHGFIASINLIFSALKERHIDGELGYRLHLVDDELEEDRTEVDFNNCKVSIASLQQFMVSHGRGEYVLVAGRVERFDFMNPKHPRFSLKLSAAVSAWKHFEDVELGPGSVKQNIVRWLHDNAEQLGLQNREGEIPTTAIEEIAKVANWQVGGGAPTRKKIED